ncbi:MAG: penicillin-binding protein 2, partial [Tissierellia bacterium]|nr:penicillin-binding protein 2 [Tissierellia bacterium]
NRGEAGIEKVYDEVLCNEGEHSVYVGLDERRKIFTKEEYLVNKGVDPKEPSGVKLTVDYHIQREVERILDRGESRGAAIVADVKTGSILAMASRPNFDQNNIYKYLDRGDMSLYNKAVQVGYPPGSLFKLVVLLAALEEDDGHLHDRFYCNGYERAGNRIIGCNNGDGHGHITLKEAFSQSCNSAFIQLGRGLGGDSIIHMANRLGFGNKLNIGLSEENKGNLPSGADLIGPNMGNISIGQGSIEVTPLQITNMMLAIANDGTRKGMSIVEGIVAQDGYMIRKFERAQDQRVISEKTSGIAREYLAEVVRDGTADNLDLDDIGGAAGKTGSAEAVLNGKKTVHGWFSGFYPLQNPQYVITVFIEEGISGSQTAVPIFSDISRSIYNINR